MSNIKYVRLLSGESVIADVKETGDRIELIDAVVAIPTNDSLAFQPLAPLADQSVKSVTIDRSHIVFMTTPAKEIESHYSQQFSKLFVPKNSVIS